MSGATVVLALAEAVSSGDADIRVTCLMPASGGVIRADGESVPGFENELVTNNTAAAPPVPATGGAGGGATGAAAAASVFALAFVAFGSSEVEARLVFGERSCPEAAFPTKTGFAFCGKSRIPRRNANNGFFHREGIGEKDFDFSGRSLLFFV